jgi:hypothetical protein
MKTQPSPIGLVITSTIAVFAVLVIAIGLGRWRRAEKAFDINQPSATSNVAKEIPNTPDPTFPNQQSKQGSNQFAGPVISLFRSPPYQEPTPGFVGMSLRSLKLVATG